MSSGYNYILHKLKIHSNFPIAELTPVYDIFPSPDIIITAEELKPDFPFCLVNRTNISEDYFFLAVKNIAIYEVFNGSEIKIAYLPEASPEEISLFLLGSCLGVILYQRSFLPLHASGIYFPDKGAVFFTGDSGAGKSTTLHAFLQKGYKMIADDVSAVKFEQEPLVYPSFPRAKIWQDSADKLNIETEGLNRVHRDMDKYSYRINSESFCDAEVKPFILYEINKYNGDRVYLEEVSGLEKINLLYKNTYRVNYLKDLKKAKEHFSQITKLAKCLKLKRIFRPENIDSISELTKIIEKDLTVL